MHRHKNALVIKKIASILLFRAPVARQPGKRSRLETASNPSEYALCYNLLVRKDLISSLATDENSVAMSCGLEAAPSYFPVSERSTAVVEVPTVFVSAFHRAGIKGFDPSSSPTPRRRRRITVRTHS